MPQNDILKSAVKTVLDGYKSKIENFDLDEFLKTGVDPFRFTVNVSIWGLKEAIRKEIEHKVEMALENLIGDFHEDYLGNVVHVPTNTKWNIVPEGEIPGIDIANYDEEIFIQIKSKHNSMNSSSSKKLAQELRQLSIEKPDATVGCAWVIAKSTKKAIGENEIKKVGRCIKGKDVYSEITGTSDEMDMVLAELPGIIQEIIGGTDFNELSDKAAKKVTESLQSLADEKEKTSIEIVTERSVD